MVLFLGLLFLFLEWWTYLPITDTLWVVWWPPTGLMWGRCGEEKENMVSERVVYESRNHRVSRSYVHLQASLTLPTHPYAFSRLVAWPTMSAISHILFLLFVAIILWLLIILNRRESKTIKKVAICRREINGAGLLRQNYRQKSWRMKE